MTVKHDNPYYQGPVSDHFDGNRFHNIQSGTEKGAREVIKWLITRDKRKWPKSVPARKIDPLPSMVKGNAIHATYINHATVIVQTNGLNIITDPVWSQRVSPLTWLGPKRVYEPPIDLENLPKIDILLISHDHYDHLDLDTIKRIYKLHKPKIYTGLGVDIFLKKHGIDAVGLDWWQSKKVTNALSVTYVPAQHWSSRTLANKNKTLWGGFVVSSGPNDIYFAGDTGYYKKHFQDIGKKFTHLKLSLLPIGAYKPLWFMKHNHINPEEAVLAAIDLNSSFNIAIHYDTFKIADEGYGEAPEDLARALKKHKKSKSWFATPLPGETIKIPY